MKDYSFTGNKISIIFFCIFGLMTCSCFYFGLRGLIFKRPFVLAGFHQALYLIITAMPILLLGYSPTMQAAISEMFRPVVILLFIFISIMIWYQMRGYRVYGVELSSVREALVGVLKGMNISFQEVASTQVFGSTFKIPATSSEIIIIPDLRSTFNPKNCCVAWIRVKDNKDMKLLQEISICLNKYFNEHKADTNLYYFWSECIGGIFMLCVTVFFYMSMLYFSHL